LILAFLLGMGKRTEPIPGVIPPGILEFPDALGPGLPLFVQTTWRLATESKAAGFEGGDTEICHLVVFDGLRCWEGLLCRKDLAGPFINSWNSPVNLRLLRSALSEIPPRRGHALDVPKAEAVWQLDTPLGQAGECSLELSVRFVYREGPVAAVRGAKLSATLLGPALARLCAQVRALQASAELCKEAAAQERINLQQRQESLKRQLECLPSQVADEEEQVLQQLCGVLNAQKRRCRRIWQTTLDAESADVEQARPPAEAGATLSLQDCLERDAAEADAGMDADQPALASPVASLTFGESLARPIAGPGEPATFSIPLTLGMSSWGGAGKANFSHV